MTNLRTIKATKEEKYELKLYILTVKEDAVCSKIK
jgi:hypothetical protein